MYANIQLLLVVLVLQRSANALNLNRSIEIEHCLNIEHKQPTSSPSADPATSSARRACACTCTTTTTISCKFKKRENYYEFSSKSLVLVSVRVFLLLSSRYTSTVYYFTDLTIRIWTKASRIVSMLFDPIT